MKKEETVKLYLDSYLQGKSDSARRTFMEKPLDKQYSCIMAWRHRMRSQAQPDSEGAVILEHVRQAHKKLSGAVNISEQELRSIETEIAALRDGIRLYNQNRTTREIEELEKQQAQIQERLRLLRNPGSDSLTEIQD